jgi:enoyl-[acyl-carrier protein] reductase II
MAGRNLADILGIKYPFIQGAMANVSDGRFAAAASNAGAMGVIASGAMTPAELADNIDLARSLTDKPFGVNIMLKNPCCDEMAELVAEKRVSFVTTGAGNPGKYMERWKDAGITVFPVVASTALARRMVNSGADGVIAEGTESGGHVGEMATMALVPQVVDMVDVPVVAAGGIADGRQFLAALALGACGAQIGTCLLVSAECPIHENYKEALLKASDSDTIVTGRFAGSPVRQLKNHMSRSYLKDEKSGQSREELGHYMIGALRRAARDGDVRDGSVLSGQVAGMLHEVKPLEQIFSEIYAGADAAYSELGGTLDEMYGENPAGSGEPSMRAGSGR